MSTVVYKKLAMLAGVLSMPLWYVVWSLAIMDYNGFGWLEFRYWAMIGVPIIFALCLLGVWIKRESVAKPLCLLGTGLFLMTVVVSVGVGSSVVGSHFMPVKDIAAEDVKSVKIWQGRDEAGRDIWQSVDEADQKQILAVLQEVDCYREPRRENFYAEYADVLQGDIDWRFRIWYGIDEDILLAVGRDYYIIKTDGAETQIFEPRPYDFGDGYVVNDSVIDTYKEMCEKYGEQPY